MTYAIVRIETHLDRGKVNQELKKLEGFLMVSGPKDSEHILVLNLPEAVDPRRFAEIHIRPVLGSGYEMLVCEDIEMSDRLSEVTSAVVEANQDRLPELVSDGNGKMVPRQGGAGYVDRSQDPSAPWRQEDHDPAQNLRSAPHTEGWDSKYGHP